MKIGSLVKIQEIPANHPQDRGKMAVIIDIRINDHGQVCKLHFFDYNFKFNEYHIGRLELVNAVY